MRRVMLACLVGMLTSTLTLGLSVGVLAYFGIGPLGQFISREIPRIMAERSFDDESLRVMHQGLVFNLLVILPLSSLVGSLVGAVISSKRWVGLAAAIPMVIVALSGKSGGIIRVSSTLLCLTIAGGVGYAVEKFSEKKQKTSGS